MFWINLFKNLYTFTELFIDLLVITKIIKIKVKTSMEDQCIKSDKATVNWN